MEHTIPHDDPAPPGVKSWQLWFSLAAGVAAWGVHLLLVYPLTSLACEWGWFPFDVAGLSGLQVVQIILTLAAGAVTAAAGFLAFQNQQRFAAEVTPETSRHRFMVHLGLALNMLFTALIMIALVPILSFPSCA